MVALALLAAWQVPRWLDWDHYRAAVERVASAGLGRPVQIAGPIRLSLLPQARLSAGNVTIADTGDGAAAVVGELRMRVGLSALLTGRVEPQDLVLQDARMHLPWPLAGFTLRGTPPPAGLHARLENGTLLLGGLAISAISGDLSAGDPNTALSASGFATVLGRPWRMTGRLGRAGSDGSATIEISLDGQGAGVGTGGALTGQVAAEGSVTGRITGRGPDLSLLLPAPPQPWTADGRLIAGSGLLVADDLELTIGGSPARGAVALRLLPQLRLDAALATNRLDLDAWLPPLLQGGAVALPTGIDLSAEAAPLAGGTLRRLRAGFELAGGQVTLRETDVVLPGEAPLQLSGVLRGSHFEGSATLTAPDFPQTLSWLTPRAPALMNAVPLGTLHTAHLAAAVQADPNSVALAGLRGDVDGVAVGGNLALRGGPRPALAADLQLVGPVLDRWAPDAPESVPQAAASLAALPKWAAGFDADVTVQAQRPVWRGTVLDRLEVDGAARSGTLEVRHAAVQAPGVAIALSGSIDPSLRITDGALALQLDHAEALADRLPAALQFSRPLLRGPLDIEATSTGPLGAWVTVARAELADARLQANGRWDLPGQRWGGSVSLHHPGAPRLLASLGLGGVAGWLGDGSLSLQASVDAAPGRVALAGVELSAGMLRGAGDIAFALPASGRPGVTGALDVETLPLPVPYLRSTNPLGFGILRACNAELTIRAEHLLWNAEMAGDPAAARIVLMDGVLHVDNVAARLGDGTLTGRLTLDANATPRLSATARLDGAVLDGPVLDLPVLGGAVLNGAASEPGLDLIAGVAAGSADVTATGYSPAALFASLGGSVSLTVRNGALSGLDAGQLLSVLQGVPASAASGPDGATLQSAVAGALHHGATPFTALTAAGTLANGLLTLTRGIIAAPSAALRLSGSLDLPGATEDLSVALQPAQDGAPTIGLRLIGPIAHPSRTPALADLTRWLADR